MTRILIDFSLGLEVSGDAETSLRVLLETEFTYTTAAGEELVAWEQPHELGRFAGLHGAVVETIVVSDAGRLDLAFTDGRRLSAEPDEHWEAFEVRSTTGFDEGGWLLVATPGGGVQAYPR